MTGPTSAEAILNRTANALNRRWLAYLLARAQTAAADRAVAARRQLYLCLSMLHGREALAGERRRQERRAARLRQLARTLQWPEDVLPETDGWAGTADFLSILADEVLARAPRLTVEFGSGLSTLVIARALQLGGGGGRLVSFDHSEGFAEITRRRLARLDLHAEVRAVPLVSSEPFGFAGRWYSPETLPPEFDLAVIDGPPAWLHTGTRGGAGPVVLPRLRPGGAVILDDAARSGEQENAERWKQAFPQIAFRYVDSEKGLLIGEVPPAGALR
jgi:predicted O-methyltransferase YrrM